MRLVSLHANGRPHRLWNDVARTPLAGAYFIHSGAEVEEADGKIWASDYPVIAFFWPKRYFQVFMLLKDNRTDYYANVILPALVTEDLFFVDLDLDVTVTNGHVELCDVMEFIDRKITYPVEWVTEAERAAQRLMQLAARQIGPFQPATAAWWRDWIQNSER